MKLPDPRRMLMFVVAVALLTWPLAGIATPSTLPALEQEPAEHLAAQEPEHAPQEGESHIQALDEEVEHGETPKEWYYWPSKWINFIALCALLYWMLVIPPQAIQDIFSFPGLRTVFIERGAAIIAARDLAAEQKQEAAALLIESEQRLARIEDEVAALVAEARADAEREQARALDDGKAQAAKIGEVAQREIKHQRVTAQRQLRGFVADLSVSLAEKTLSEHLTADDQDRLIREYLSRLGQSMA